jgi:hypothetical protein
VIFSQLLVRSFVLVLIVVLVLETGRAEWWSDGVLGTRG